MWFASAKVRCTLNIVVWLAVRQLSMLSRRELCTQCTFGTLRVNFWKYWKYWKIFVFQRLYFHTKPVIQPSIATYKYVIHILTCQDKKRKAWKSLLFWSHIIIGDAVYILLHWHMFHWRMFLRSCFWKLVFLPKHLHFFWFFYKIVENCFILKFDID